MKRTSRAPDHHVVRGEHAYIITFLWGREVMLLGVADIMVIFQFSLAQILRVVRLQLKMRH